MKYDCAEEFNLAVIYSKLNGNRWEKTVKASCFFAERDELGLLQAKMSMMNFTSKNKRISEQRQQPSLCKVLKNTHSIGACFIFYFFVMLPCSTEETKEVCNDSFALYESIACCNKAEPNCLGVYFVCHNPYAKEPGTELISFTYNVPSQTRQSTLITPEKCNLS